MDSEEYYDSLDEDSNYGSLGSSEEFSNDVCPKKAHKPSKIPVKNNHFNLFQHVNITQVQEDDVIPFYDQSLSKSEIELKKKSELCGHKQKKKPGKKNALATTVTGKTKSNSYLGMFYAKMGVEKLDLTNRATCRDSSPKSEVFEQASSVYLSEIESTYSSNNNNTKDPQELSLSLTSLDTKLCSVSQINGFIVDNKPKKNFTKISAVKIPELGRLGPEIPKDKLELLKKRQEYGLKVSRKNKIKMVEKKLLQNLQQEIKESKKHG